MASEVLRDICDVVRRGRAVAEFEEWAYVAAYHERRVAQIDRSDEILLSKELARREVTLQLAQALHVTERHVWAIVTEAATIRSPGVGDRRYRRTAGHA